MAKEYVKLWDSYAAYFEPLSDAEVGRLVLGMLKYKSTGTAPEFNGNERFVWPAIRRDIDAAIEAQQALSVTRSNAGKQGGRPKTKNNDEKANENKCFEGKAKKSMDKVKDKDKDMVKDNIAAAATARERCGMDAVPPPFGDAEHFLPLLKKAPLPEALPLKTGDRRRRAWFLLTPGNVWCRLSYDSIPFLHSFLLSGRLCEAGPARAVL